MPATMKERDDLYAFTVLFFEAYGWKTDGKIHNWFGDPAVYLETPHGVVPVVNHRGCFCTTRRLPGIPMDVFGHGDLTHMFMV